MPDLVRVKKHRSRLSCILMILALTTARHVMAQSPLAVYTGSVQTTDVSTGHQYAAQTTKLYIDPGAEVLLLPVAQVNGGVEVNDLYWQAIAANSTSITWKLVNAGAAAVQGASEVILPTSPGNLPTTLNMDAGASMTATISGGILTFTISGSVSQPYSAAFRSVLTFVTGTSGFPFPIPPGPPPAVTTNAAAGISPTAATIGGTVNPNGASTIAYFEWGMTTSYGKSDSGLNAGAGTTVEAYSAHLTGLSCATTYHFRAVASNSGGTTYGDDLTFATSACSSGSGARFYTLTPCRLIDTRLTGVLIDNVRYEVNVVNYCSIPATARSVSANVTVVASATGGYGQIWPAQAANPGTSVISFSAGQVRANNAVLTLAPGSNGSPGAISVLFPGSGSVQLIIDVNGYFQ